MDIGYKLPNIIKESDINSSLSTNYNNKREDFKSRTEMKTRTDSSNNKNYFNLKIEKVPCARTELIAKAKSDSGNHLHLNQDNVMHPYVKKTESYIISDLDNGGQLVGNKETNTYKTKRQLNSLAELEKRLWTCINAYNANKQKPAIKNSCSSYILSSQTDETAVTKLVSDHMDFSYDKDMRFLMTTSESNIRTTPDDYLDMNPRREICPNMKHSKSNPKSEQHNNDNLDLNKDKKKNIYVLHRETNTITELDKNKHLSSVPEDDKKSYSNKKTQIGIHASPEVNKDDHLVRQEPNSNIKVGNDYLKLNLEETNISVAEPGCCDHLDSSFEKKKHIHNTFIEPIAIVKQDNDDGFYLNQGKDRNGQEKLGAYTTHIEPNVKSDLYNNGFDLNSQNEACNYVIYKEPISISKLNDGDHLHLNPEVEIRSYRTHLESNIRTATDNNNCLDCSLEKDTRAYVTDTKLNATAEPDNSNNFNLNLDKNTYIHKKQEPDAVKEMDKDEHFSFHSCKETYVKKTEFNEKLNELHTTPSIIHQFILWMMHILGSQ